jgi:DME family drug/metabolite transporter
MKTSGTIEILLSGFFFGTIPIFSEFLHKLGVSSFQQAFFRLAISVAIILCIILLSKRIKELEVHKTDLLVFFVSGFFLSMAYLTYLSSISLGTPVIKAVFLTYTQPLFLIILGKLFLKESLPKTKFIAAVLSVAGAALMLQIWTIDSSYRPFVGDILAVLNGFFYASYIIIGRYVRIEKKYNSIATTFWSLILGLVWLTPCWLLIGFVTVDRNVAGFSLVLPSIAWIFLFGLALFSTVLPYILLNKGLKEVAASQAGIMLLVEPISVVLMGALLFQDTLNYWQIAGGFFILFSIVIINFRQSAR